MLGQLQFPTGNAVGIGSSSWWWWRIPLSETQYGCVSIQGSGTGSGTGSRIIAENIYIKLE